MIVKLNAAVQTAIDFEELAEVFGFIVNVRPGKDVSGFPFTFPIDFLGSATEAKFTIVVEVTNIIGEGFPFTFPITFGEPTLDIMKCFFEKLKPANAQILFIQV